MNVTDVLGFTEAAEPTNDPLYPDSNLTCRGNIRFGANGAAGARTVSLVLPCVPMVRDSALSARCEFQ